MTATTRRTALALAAVVVLAALGWYLQDGSSPSPGSGEPGTVSGTVTVADLPSEARATLDLIDAGGPFPYPDNDGIVFQNREGLLPDQPRGYYHEYTVPTPGSQDRGARRIITGGSSDDPHEYYWTDDHYRSFEEILR